MKIIKTCSNCGIDLPTGQRIDSRFCTDLCKNTYWNNQKRVIARRDKAEKAIDDIIALLGESNEAIWALRRISEKINAVDLIPQTKNNREKKFIYMNLDDRYGDYLAVTINDYTELNPDGNFSLKSDGIYEDGQLIAEAVIDTYNS